MSDVPLCVAGGGAWFLESELAVRGLAAALAAAAFFVLEHEVDGGGGDGFADVAAADAGGIRAIPVAFDDHRTATTRADARQCFLHVLDFSLSLPATEFSFVKAITHY